MQKLPQQEFGVSVIALGGKPKQITSEAFTAALIPALTRGKGLRRVHMIGLIDYDPEVQEDMVVMLKVKKTLHTSQACRRC